ncbi:MAG: hypothetical protein HZA08_05760 [Nitrospirae bacterium]|nr:hypothetical protein [Nitrospirota bacterium]
METLVGKDIYTQLASMFDYPGDMGKIVSKVDELINNFSSMEKLPPDVVNSVKEFKKAIVKLPIDELQVIYSYTFEMSSDFTLDMGSHIYDGFKRSDNLVNIKTMYRRFEFPFETLGKGELPDHLPLVLRFLGFVKEEGVKRDFEKDFLIKCLEKVYKNFAKRQDNPYHHVINAVYKIIDRDVKEEANK